MDLVGFLRDWRRVGKAEVDMEVGAEVVEAKEEDEEEEEKKEKKEKEKEKEDNKIGVAEKFPQLPCLLQVCYCYSGACKGGTLCGPVFLFF